MASRRCSAKAQETVGRTNGDQRRLAAIEKGRKKKINTAIFAGVFGHMSWRETTHKHNRATPRRASR